MRKIIYNFEFEKCPICGGIAEWVGSEVDKVSYYDEYKCGHCESKYTVAFDMFYNGHYIDEKEV